RRCGRSDSRARDAGLARSRAHDRFPRCFGWRGGPRRIRIRRVARWRHAGRYAIDDHVGPGDRSRGHEQRACVPGFRDCVLPVSWSAIALRSSLIAASPKRHPRVRVSGYGGSERPSVAWLSTKAASIGISLQGIAARHACRCAASARATRTRPELATITAFPSCARAWQIVNVALLPPALPLGWKLIRLRPPLLTTRVPVG